MAKNRQLLNLLGGAGIALGVGDAGLHQGDVEASWVPTVSALKRGLVVMGSERARF